MECKIRQVFADSMSDKCHQLVDKLLQGEKLDFAFIDAAYDYESVKHNFERLVLPRLSPSGVVLLDDYNRPLTHVGVSHYLSRKAHDDNHVFYWFAPPQGNTTCVIFVNTPEARKYKWCEIAAR